MASIKLTILLLLIAAGAEAQSFSFGDLFSQASKQKKNYLAQIAAYQAFESELKQGYNVMKNGLAGIRDINTAELNAHTAYYQSLRTVSAPVKNSNQAADILNWQVEINDSFNQSFSGLTGDEQSYIATVKTEVLTECNADLTDLQNLLTNDKLQMTDDERLRRLAKIHTAMQDKYEFTRSFCNSVKLLAAQRQQSINETQTLKSIYETP
ncbi:MAG: hypothetical protein JWR50_4264 [Mucilaginibacter sp.]|nr:hypothetical protein [Mucilaginibacter sp.]